VTLDISHVTEAEEGKYTCTAENRLGVSVESLSLIVDDVIVCEEDEFRCKSGDQCIPKTKRCDKHHDCRDNSDEHHCRRSKTAPK